MFVLGGNTRLKNRTNPSDSTVPPLLFGRRGVSLLDDFWRLDLDILKWTQIPVNIPAIASHGAIVVRDSMYVMGGQHEELVLNPKVKVHCGGR